MRSQFHIIAPKQRSSTRSIAHSTRCCNWTRLFQCVLAAKLGLLSNSIKATVERTDYDLTADADLGLLFSEKTAREVFGNRI